MKCCIICFDFNRSNINRQPWKYVYEVAKSLIRKGVDLKIISNGIGQMPEIDVHDNLNVVHVDRLGSMFGWSKEVRTVLKKENPDVIVILLGLTSLLKPSLKTDKPTIGILTSPVYCLKDILNLGLSEIVYHFRYLLIHLIGAVMPGFLIRSGLNSFERLVVLSWANKERLDDCGIDPERVVVIPHGIDESDLEQPKEQETNDFRKRTNPDGVSVVLYFGSPLTLRGTDTLIKAFAVVRKDLPSKLVILSRLEHEELISEEAALRRLVRKKGITDSVEIVSGILERKDLRRYLAIADVVCLPFKLVISDVPITVIESMAMGKPTISTNVDGITELLEGRGLLVKPCDSDELARSMLAALTDRELARRLGINARKYMCDVYPRWDQIEKSFAKYVNENFKR